ncbi:hypothetical protein QUB63_31985 [Microcoleus sp. ARI1-B5]|uniref:hypothetical protein n=1 Tax=unclassified Microcoleus TaxID=2642155 RepID=UPI002FD3FEAF
MECFAGGRSIARSHPTGYGRRVRYNSHTAQQPSTERKIYIARDRSNKSLGAHFQAASVPKSSSAHVWRTLISIEVVTKKDRSSICKKQTEVACAKE